MDKLYLGIGIAIFMTAAVAIGIVAGCYFVEYIRDRRDKNK